jgi:hexosaminidase
LLSVLSRGWVAKTFFFIFFWQLVSYDLTSGTYNIVGTPIEITDAPRFGWRGLLIDTARHYLSIASIKRTIDALSYVKMNTLHWHAVDAQSFPIVSQRFPFLTKGAYAPNAIYTAADITGIIEYGRQRGVRVIAEFDVPGHAAAWGVGDPSLVVTCPKYSRNINNIPLDVTKQHTYDVLNGFLNEMVTLFTDQYIHLGGDEVVYGCWLDNQGVLDYMKQHGIQSATQLYQMFGMLLDLSRSSDHSCALSFADWLPRRKQG